MCCQEGTFEYDCSARARSKRYIRIPPKPHLFYITTADRVVYVQYMKGRRGVGGCFTTPDNLLTFNTHTPEQKYKINSEKMCVYMYILMYEYMYVGV